MGIPPKTRSEGRFLTGEAQGEFIHSGRDVPLLQPALPQLLHGQDQLRNGKREKLREDQQILLDEPKPCSDIGELPDSPNSLDFS